MSEVKVNKIDKRTGSTLTIGGSGTTVTLACGATQTGFGRTGTVDWCTTAKTAPFTAVSGNGYFVNTTSGAVTVTLPASPSAGDIISIADYASTFQTNNVTLCRNSSKINATCNNAYLSTKGQSVTLIYVDGTRGWKNTMDSTSDVTGQGTHIVATGGTITCSGDYKIHTFTGPGTFDVTAGTCSANNEISYLVVAGGGGGGGDQGGGGGAGGFREDKSSNDTYTASPLDGAGTFIVTSQSYPITVGAGGTAGAGQGPCSPNAPQGSKGGNGSNSIFSTITSAGGGGGAKESTAPTPGPNDGNGLPGGSGGGGSWTFSGLPQAGQGGTGNSPAVSPPQGNNGGTPTGYPGTNSPSHSSSGGGGATAVGGSAVPNGAGGAGGAGATTSISATPTSYSGGGGGSGGSCGPAGAGGTGGGGAGSVSATGTAGTANTGGGGGGGYPDPYGGGAGGSGIVIVRYKYQN